VDGPIQEYYAGPAFDHQQTSAERITR